MKKYKNYIFDLYGTLVDIHTDEGKPSFWKKISDIYCENGAKYSYFEIKKAYLDKVNAAEKALKAKLERSNFRKADSHESHPEIPLEQIFAELYTDKGVSPSEQLIYETAIAFREASTTHLRAYSGAVTLLRALRAGGAKVYLLSNAQHIFTEYEMRKLGLWDEFDDIFISSDHSCRKPDVNFYLALIGARRLNKADCLMIGNDPQNDIKGAKMAGIDAMYIQSALSPHSACPVEDAKAAGSDYIQDHMDLHLLCQTLLG